MLNKLLLTLFILISVQSARAEFGIGAAGGILYPGLIKSEISSSQFRTGWGYELFLSHNIFRLSDTLQVKARWSYRQYINEIELPYILDTWFTFRYLNINLLTDFYHFDTFALYAGIGANLVSVRANRDFFDYTETSFAPELNFGLKWILSQNYEIFSELSVQYGQINDVFEEDISIFGFRLVIGATMYLSEAK
jgi:hypothetical protein